MEDSLPPLSEEAKNFKPGIYKHYKGGVYKGLFVARHSENPEEELVIYKSVDDGLVWARPVKMFSGEVEKNGDKISRFEYIGGENSEDPKTTVAVSGGFDPLHKGHVRMCREAKKLGDELVVILNNDNWLRAKKNHVFMEEQERAEIVEELEAVDKVVISEHPEDPEDMSVARELKKVSPDIFANGGDRKEENTPEGEVCEEIGCKMVYNIGEGGKVQSSSWILANYLKSSQENE